MLQRRGRGAPWGLEGSVLPAMMAIPPVIIIILLFIHHYLSQHIKLKMLLSTLSIPTPCLILHKNSQEPIFWKWHLLPPHTYHQTIHCLFAFFLFVGNLVCLLFLSVMFCFVCLLSLKLWLWTTWVTAHRPAIGSRKFLKIVFLTKISSALACKVAHMKKASKIYIHFLSRIDLLDFVNFYLF